MLEHTSHSLLLLSLLCRYASNLHIAYLLPMKEVRRAFPDDVYSFTPSGEGTWTVAAVTLSNGKTPSAFSEEQAGIQVRGQSCIGCSMQRARQTGQS